MIAGWRCPLVAATCAAVALAVGCGGGGSSSSSSGGGATQPEHIVITSPGSLEAAQTLPFMYALQETGATAAVTWSITSGTLPDGLTLAAQSGVISGMPSTQASGQTVGVQATDGKASGNATFYIGITGRLTINPFTATVAHTNVPYSFAVSAQGATVNAWSISTGQLPPGLTLSSTGNLSADTISGTPSQTGTYAFTVQVTGGDNLLPQTATADGSITVDSHLTITKATLKNGEQLQPYSDSFASVNGIAPLAWTLDSPLPPGLGLNATTGQVAGTPSTAGASISYSYNVTVTDSKVPPQTASSSGTVQIATPLQISSALDPVYLNTPYYSQLNATGGFSPYTWTILSGTLPSGLSLSATGVLSGSTNQLGAYPLTLQVADSLSPPVTVTQAVTLHVTPTPVNVSGNPISPAPVNVLYHSQVPVSGGTPPYTFSLSSGSLPLGLTLDPATGYIDGTPTQIGTYNFSPLATDSSSPPQSGTSNDFIQITKALGRNDSIATATPLGNLSSNSPTFSISPYIDPINASTANPDTDYFKLTATAGSPIHVETIAQRGFGVGNLDTVIELLNQSGTRLQTCGAPSYNSACLNDDLNTETTDSALDLLLSGPAGTEQTFYLRVLDWRGDARPDMQYYLSISGVDEPLRIAVPLQGLGSYDKQGSTKGVAFQQQLNYTGGTGAVTWSVISGALPPGWTLSSTGLLSGTATTDGTYTFTLQVRDSANPAKTAQQQYTWMIVEPLIISSSPTLPNACANQYYSFTFTASGGIPPRDFELTTTSLNYPTGITLNSMTGVLSGTASGPGTATAGIFVRDGVTSSATQTFTLTTVTCP